MKIAIVGATGMVGRELLSLLEKRKFPAKEVRLFSSSRSLGSSISFKGRLLRTESLEVSKLRGTDLVFLAVEEELSKKIAPVLARQGIWVIDDSSAFRMDPNVPLVIPEINSHEINSKTRLIAGPNCTAAVLLMGVYPLHREFRLVHLRAASYQAVSGAGAAALRELKNQLIQWAKGGKSPDPKALPQTIAFNVFPHIGSFDSQGYSGEEVKVAQECRKILGLPSLKISCTTVRVPVLRGHSLALWIETKKSIEIKKCRDLLNNFNGAELLDDPTRKKYPTPLLADSKWPVYIGRLRRGENSKELLLWVSGDNLLKGAALNSVQIAEHLIKKRLL